MKHFIAEEVIWKKFNISLQARCKFFVDHSVWFLKKIDFKGKAEFFYVLEGT